MKELKPCPFCGGEVDWCKNDLDFHLVTDDCHYITCERCGEFSLNMLDSAEFPKVYNSLADQWNMRASIEVSKIEELMLTYGSEACLWASTKSVRFDLQKLIDKAKQ